MGIRVGSGAGDLGDRKGGGGDGTGRPSHGPQSNRPVKKPLKPIENPLPVDLGFRLGIFRILEERDDFLICKGYDPHGPNAAPRTVNVAKPSLLQRTRWDGQTVEMIVRGERTTATLEYDDEEVGKRVVRATVDGEEVEETEWITQPYFVGDHIIATRIKESRAVEGVDVYAEGSLPNVSDFPAGSIEGRGRVQWIDLNVSGRDWGDGGVGGDEVVVDTAVLDADMETGDDAVSAIRSDGTAIFAHSTFMRGQSFAGDTVLVVLADGEWRVVAGDWHQWMVLADAESAVAKGGQFVVIVNHPNNEISASALTDIDDGDSVVVMYSEITNLFFAFVPSKTEESDDDGGADCCANGGGGPGMPGPGDGGFLPWPPVPGGGGFVECNRAECCDEDSPLPIEGCAVCPDGAPVAYLATLGTLPGESSGGSGAQVFEHVAGCVYETATFTANNGLEGGEELEGVYKWVLTLAAGGYATKIVLTNVSGDDWLPPIVYVAPRPWCCACQNVMELECPARLLDEAPDLSWFLCVAPDCDPVCAIWDDFTQGNDGSIEGELPMIPDSGAWEWDDTSEAPDPPTHVGIAKKYTAESVLRLEGVFTSNLGFPASATLHPTPHGSADPAGQHQWTVLFRTCETTAVEGQDPFDDSNTKILIQASEQGGAPGHGFTFNDDDTVDPTVGSAESLDWIDGKWYVATLVTTAKGGGGWEMTVTITQEDNPANTVSWVMEVSAIDEPQFDSIIVSATIERNSPADVQETIDEYNIIGSVCGEPA